MYIRELSYDEFEKFSENHPLSNYHQTVNYALLKSDNGYEYEMIGYCDDDNIYAAALILVKLLDGYCYAYVPEGYLIDYSNTKLLKDFTKAIIKFYKKEKISFIKINPMIVIGEINSKTHKKEYNDNYQIVKDLEDCGYKKLDDNLYFESILPKYNTIINLNEYSLDKLQKNTKNKIRKSLRKGLSIELGNQNDIHYLESFVQRKIKRNSFYYNDYYSIYSKKNNIDLWLVSVDYVKFTENAQKSYEKESNINYELNKKVVQKPTPKNINRKMNSDKALLAYKNDLAIATKYLNESKKEYIAGALVIKHKDTASIIISGYDKKYSSYVPNYFLYYKLIEQYKKDFKYLDLNGITGDFSKTNKYYGLNEFKLGFNPMVYEYIGEFDLIINRSNYDYLDKKGLLAKEFTNSFKK